MRVTISPTVLADMFRDGNELHVLIKSPIKKGHVLIGAILKDGNIELIFEDYNDEAESVIIQTLPQD